MTSMGEREIGAISRKLPDNLGELAYVRLQTFLTTYTKVPRTMTSAKVTKALLQLFICFVHLTLGSGLKKSPI